jgi:hypothetical protein
MSLEREGEPVLNSGPYADACNKAEELQAKLDRLRAVIARDNELQELSKLESDDPHGAEISKLMGESSDIFFEFATRPLKNDLEFSIVQACTEHFMREKPIEYAGTIEDAIDTVLQEVNDDATSPLATGLLAIVRYRIESQRRQLAST